MLSNEEYLDSKNLKLYTTVDNIEQNIITDPKLIPNGLHSASHNNNLGTGEELALAPADNTNQEENLKDGANKNEDENQNKNENEKIDAMVVQSEDKMEKVNTYASQLLANLTKNSNNNKASKNKKNKRNNSKKLLQKSRNNMHLEIMKVFPLSLVILLLIFIILLIVCIGVR